MRKRLCRTAQIKSIRYHMKNRSYSGAHTWDGMGQKKFTSYWHHRWSVSLRGINSIRKMFNGFLCTNVCVCASLSSFPTALFAQKWKRARFTVDLHFQFIFWFFFLLFFFKSPISFILLSIFLKWRMNWNENQIETVTTTTSINTNNDNEHTEKKNIEFFPMYFLNVCLSCFVLSVILHSFPQKRY